VADFDSYKYQKTEAKFLILHEECVEAMSSEKVDASMVTVPLPLDAKAEATGSIHNINERALVRKIDYRIVPLMFFCYLMQFLDKVMINVSNGSCTANV